MAIVARLVQLMHGRVWVESEVGRGSTFHMAVRVGQQAVREQAEPRAEPVDVRGLPVLVVDDNATSRGMDQLRMRAELLHLIRMVEERMHAVADLIDRGAMARR